MIFGPFKLRVSSQAEQIDYDSLDNECKGVLCSGISFSSITHGIYRFFVVPEPLVQSLTSPEKLSRKQKKLSYHKADRVVVQTEPLSEDIQFLGIFPTTCTVDGQWSLDLSTEAVFEITVPKLMKFKIKGNLKNKIRKTKYSVFAARTNDCAQWIFLKHWVKSGSPLSMQILCLVPRSIDSSKRYIICNAQVQQKGRRLARAIKKKVSFPA